MVQLNFNATGVAPTAAFEPLPTGIYPVVITKSEQKPTRAGDGSYIELEMTVQGGEFANRKVFDRLNIVNKNQTAVDIAYATLSAICHVTGRLQIQQTEQLHGVPFQAVVKKVPRSDQPENMTNEVVGYKDVAGNDPGKGGAAAAGGQPSWAQNQPAQPQATQPAQQQQAWQQPDPNAQQAQPQMQQQAQPQQQGQAPWQPQQVDPNQQQQASQPAQGGAPAGATPPWLANQG